VLAVGWRERGQVFIEANREFRKTHDRS
jgi:hypothetical protein